MSGSAMTMPEQRRGKSKQDYGTPWEFIRAIEARFGPIVCDLAAHAKNAKCATYIPPEEDSLTVPWAERWPVGTLWLNPPFGDIYPWAAKCRTEGAKRNGVIVMLTPASVATTWFAECVHGYAREIPIQPRISFDGMPVNPRTGKIDSYPKDLAIWVYGKATGGFEIWRWKADGGER